MAVVKKFADFFDKLNFTYHYLDRTSYDSEITRIRKKSDSSPDGWECKFMVECDSLGNQTGGRIYNSDFIKLYREVLYKKDISKNITMTDAHRDFAMRVSVTLRSMTNNPLIEKRVKEYSRQTYVNLGKIVFELKIGEETKYYFPLFLYRDKQHSSNIWLISKYNNAVTIKYMTNDYNNVYRNIYLTYYNGREEIKNVFKLSPEDYIEKYVLVDINSINQTIIITQDEDWRKNIYNQIEKS